MKGVIVVGDSTSHGGSVLTGQQNFRINGKPVACEGDTVSCPQEYHPPVSTISNGSSLFTINGRRVATEDSVGGCGCKLIAGSSLVSAQS